MSFFFFLVGFHVLKKTMLCRRWASPPPGSGALQTPHLGPSRPQESPGQLAFSSQHPEAVAMATISLASPGLESALT